MKKDLGVKPYTFPMPVLMIATYGENDKVGVMNMAWGGVCASNMVALNIDEDRSDKVDAPVIEEYPLTLECRVVALENTVYGFRVLGEIVNVLADEKVLDEKGRVDPTRLNAFIFDQCQSGYYKVGEKVGQAWKSGTRFMK